jgi:hypothetical protein
MDDQGYQVLTGATTPDAIEAYTRGRASAIDGLLVRERGGSQVELASSASDDAGAVDPYAIVPEARAVLLPDAVTTALSERFGGEAPLLFDAAETAAVMQEDGPYRDATYVALSAEPDTLVTLVVALDDASVEVFPGSQAIETTPFSGRYPHFNPERDGEDAIVRHREELASRLGGAERIALGAGDVLILSANTVHRPIEDPALVAHACPSRVHPGWYAYRPERARHASVDDGRAWLASQHYDLVDALQPEQAPADGEIEQVEDALREHDRELATEPPPGASAETRRSGGLVDSVRGILGRRGRR